jgi:hypothetical protein
LVVELIACRAKAGERRICDEICNYYLLANPDGAFCTRAAIFLSIDWKVVPGLAVIVRIGVNDDSLSGGTAFYKPQVSNPTVAWGRESINCREKRYECDPAQQSLDEHAAHHLGVL